jgi:hypothetical protein
LPETAPGPHWTAWQIIRRLPSDTTHGCKPASKELSMNRFLAGATAIGLTLSLGGIAEADFRNGQRVDDERLDRAPDACGDRDALGVYDPWKLDFDPDDRRYFDLRYFDYWDAQDFVAAIRD